MLPQEHLVLQQFHVNLYLKTGLKPPRLLPIRAEIAPGAPEIAPGAPDNAPVAPVNAPVAPDV